MLGKIHAIRPHKNEKHGLLYKASVHISQNYLLSPNHKASVHI